MLTFSTVIPNRKKVLVLVCIRIVFKVIAVYLSVVNKIQFFDNNIVAVVDD